MYITSVFSAVLAFITIVKNDQFKSLSLFESESDFYSLSANFSFLLQMTDKWTVSFKDFLCKWFYVEKTDEDCKFFIYLINNAYMIYVHF